MCSPLLGIWREHPPLLRRRQERDDRLLTGAEQLVELDLGAVEPAHFGVVAGGQEGVGRLEEVDRVGAVVPAVERITCGAPVMPSAPLWSKCSWVISSRSASTPVTGG
jgi:hypothetical protein